MSAQFYRCPSCGATKEIMDRPREDYYRQPETVFPIDLPCGWRGCEDRAVKVDR